LNAAALWPLRLIPAVRQPICRGFSYQGLMFAGIRRQILAAISSIFDVAIL
jgi:hypothetical protein